MSDSIKIIDVVDKITIFVNEITNIYYDIHIDELYNHIIFIDSLYEYTTDILIEIICTDINLFYTNYDSVSFIYKSNEIAKYYKNYSLNNNFSCIGNIKTYHNEWSKYAINFYQNEK